MSSNILKVEETFRKLRIVKGLNEWSEEVKPLIDEDIISIDSFPPTEGYNSIGRNQRLKLVSEKTKTEIPFLSNTKVFDDYESLQGNIEEFVGMIQVPMGIAGPLVVNGTHAKGDFLVPLATTEGALVASYNRGMKACRLSGGVASICLVEGVQRCPLFQFETIAEAGQFVYWVLDRTDVFDLVVEEASNYADLSEVKANIEGNTVILTFEFSTGDAAGQNMVTICADAICQHIMNACPIPIRHWYIDGNFSGDKKATASSFSSVRGKKVAAEIVLKKEIVDKVLKTTPAKMAQYWRSSTLGVVQSGAIGAQGHYANGLAALFMACGQDVACISEASIGITRMEVTDKNDLYVSVTMPNLIVGTIGGGTHLPTQNECLSILNCNGRGKAKKFAEIAAAVCLAGEISIAAAMSSNQYTDAHRNLGRR